MPQCTKIRIKHRKLCSGDLDRFITIMNRTLDAPIDDSTDFQNNFSNTKKTWAGLSTTKGEDVFFATNLDEAVTHVFYTRFFSWLTTENWIKYKGQNFDILEVEDIDERGEWNAIYCNVRGCSVEPVNHA